MSIITQRVPYYVMPLERPPSMIIYPKECSWESHNLAIGYKNTWTDFAYRWYSETSPHKDKTAYAEHDRHNKLYLTPLWLLRHITSHHTPPFALLLCTHTHGWHRSKGIILPIHGHQSCHRHSYPDSNPYALQFSLGDRNRVAIWGA